MIHMSYCINPNCLYRQNSDLVDVCKTCGTPLRIQERYRLVQPLRDLNCSMYIEVFEVEDGHNNNKVLKILKTDHEELNQISRREAQVLSWLDHPGIPKVEPEPDGYFLFPAIGDISLHCTVMEKIEGQTLSQWLTRYKLSSASLTLKWLKELTQILEQVHKNHLFHRDIKPSNIIRRPNGQLALIDFGAVEQNMAALCGQENLHTILTVGYAPPEQFERQAVRQSDFFALGRTFVHLLTRKHPLDIEEIDGRLIWRTDLPEKLPPLLLDLIDDLMHPSVSHRPNSTTEIQQRLDHIFHTLLASPNLYKPEPPQPSKIKWYKPTKIKVLSLFTIILAIGITYRPQLEKYYEAIINHKAIITVGETTLLSEEVHPEKQKGMDAFAARDYTGAVKHFKASIDDAQHPNDPEARIFLNNAQIGFRKSYTIAVSIPLICSANRVQNVQLKNIGSPDSTHRILQGAGAAQEEINRQGGINHIPLRLAIVCSNDQDDATLVAQEVIKHPEILGIVGPPARKAAQASEKFYCGSIVSIAPNSASEELKNCDHFTFRMLPSDSTTAKKLSEYMLTVQQRQKAVIFFDSKNLHSKSLRKEFEHSLTLSGGKVLDQFDLSAPRFNAKKSVELALSKSTDVLVLFPDSYILDKALEVVNVNQQRLPLLAGANMFDVRTLNKTRQNSSGMVVAAPCNDEKEDLSNWRYVLAYESIQSFSTALRLNPSRAGIRSALSSPNFQSKGICEPVRFLPSDDRNAKVRFAKVLPGWQSGTGYDFVSLPEF
jgi:eukaryotic-like serine/threonine-protein kinase